MADEPDGSARLFGSYCQTENESYIIGYVRNLSTIARRSRLSHADDDLSSPVIMFGLIISFTIIIIF